MGQAALAQFAAAVFCFELCILFSGATTIAFIVSFFVNVHF
jgi:hypothetical protein